MDCWSNQPLCRQLLAVVLGHVAVDVLPLGVHELTHWQTGLYLEAKGP